MLSTTNMPSIVLSLDVLRHEYFPSLLLLTHCFKYFLSSRWYAYEVNSKWVVYDESTLLVDVPILFFTEKEFFSNKNIGFRTDNGHSKELSSFVLWTRLLLLLYTAKVATTAIADSTSCKKFFSDTFVCMVCSS